MYSQLVDYSTRMSTRIPYNVANNNALAITYAVTTAASGDITEKNKLLCILPTFDDGISGT